MNILQKNKKGIFFGLLTSCIMFSGTSYSGDSGFIKEKDKIQTRIELIEMNTKLSEAQKNLNDARELENPSDVNESSDEEKIPFMLVEYVRHFKDWSAKIGTSNGTFNVKNKSVISGIGVISEINSNGILVILKDGREVVYGIGDGVYPTLNQMDGIIQEVTPIPDSSSANNENN